MYQSGNTRWQRITRYADEARLLMMRDREVGERAFLDLVSGYPDDGMPYLKRGEALEYLGDYASAIRDYDRAAALFSRPAWRLQARKARARARAQWALSQVSEASESVDGTSDATDQQWLSACTRCSRLLDEIPAAAPELQRRVLAPFWYYSGSHRLAAIALRRAVCHVICKVCDVEMPRAEPYSTLVKIVRDKVPALQGDVEFIFALRTDPSSESSVPRAHVLTGSEAMIRILEWWRDCARQSR